MSTIHTRVEGERGCGTRKPGGIYLVSDGPGRPCGRIPFPLEKCPTCDHGIKLIRSWTWIDAGTILDGLPTCPHLDLRIGPAPRVGQAAACWSCPLHAVAGRVGLLSVGSKFYKTPAAFMAEAERMGLSRRIPAVPKEFVLGETWVWLAHRQAIPKPCTDKLGHFASGPDFKRAVHEAILDQPPSEPEPLCVHCKLPTTEWMGPGVFYVFQPQRIEYVVKDDDPEDKLTRLEKRGITLVKIERLEDQPELPLESTSHP